MPSRGYGIPRAVFIAGLQQILRIDIDDPLDVDRWFLLFVDAGDYISNRGYVVA